MASTKDQHQPPVPLQGAAKPAPLPSSKATNGAANNHSNMGMLRGWFDSLNREERMVALGFVDDAFLQTILALKKLSANDSSLSTAEKQPGEKNVWVTKQQPSKAATAPSHSIQWDESYSLETIQNVWDSFVGSGSNGGGNNHQNQQTPQQPAPSRDVSKDKQKASEGSSVDGKDKMTLEKQQNLNVFMNHVKVIFPCVHTRHQGVKPNSPPLQGNKIRKNSYCTTLDYSVKGTLPHREGKTITPAANSASETKLMGALDAIAKSLYGRPFLSLQGESSRLAQAAAAKTAEERSRAKWTPEWMQSSMIVEQQQQQSSSVLQVPLYALVFSRLEAEVAFSYHQRRQVSVWNSKAGPGKSAALVEPSNGNAGENPKVVEGDDVTVMKFILSQQEKLASINPQIPHHKSELLLAKLFGVGSGDTNKKNTHVSLAGGPTIRFQAPMLVMLPISLLLAIALSAENSGKNKRVSLGEINARVESALADAKRTSTAPNYASAAATAVRTPAPTIALDASSPPSNASSSTVEVQQTPDSASVSSEQVGSTTKKRKKPKKKKKNKNKGASPTTENPTSQSNPNSNNVANNNHNNNNKAAPKNVTTDVSGPSKAINGVSDTNDDGRLSGESDSLLRGSAGARGGANNSSAGRNSMATKGENGTKSSRDTTTTQSISTSDENKGSSETLSQNPSQSLSSPTKSGPGSPEASKKEAVKDDDEWETVGTRSRGRKKAGDFNSHNGGNSNNNAEPPSGSSRADALIDRKRGKGEKKPAAASKRKNNASKKIAREIIFSLLDGVDEEVRNQGSNIQTTIPTSHNGASAETGDVEDAPTKQQSQDQPPNKGPTESKLTGSSESKWGGAAQSHPQELPTSTNQKHQQPRAQQHSNVAEAVQPVQKKSSPADQSTAPTYQETVSSFSANTDREKREPSTLQKQVVTPTKSESGQIVDDVPQPVSDRVPSSSSTYQNKSFPLPTLLSPENANSTTSSVGSSLEAPHGHNHLNPSASAALDDNAVGFHLLDVCDRLSKDMSLFMKSRDHTVTIRRNERAVLLGALQETVSGIWPNSCRVEMYGSCATLLDLPSSDLDVVITGLDRSDVFWNSPEYMRGDAADEGFKAQSHGSQSHYMPVYSPNAHRVMKLSAEIERLPWAVKVKSIPNATVPVIKILADPSKISGSAHNSDWAGPSGYASSIPSDQFGNSGDASTGSAELPIPPASTSHRPYEPWRGSDVMNGLISLDITFEGPEHGGIGSTEYSMHVVNQMCQETGLRPEDTPFVQCLMVLKELLAQRKLNEPYSGGLSSYALLLLLTALLRERAAIRAEIERSAQHRQTSMAVGAHSLSPEFGPDQQQSSPVRPSVKKPSDAQTKKNGKELKKQAKSSGSNENVQAASSWASVARKTDAATAQSSSNSSGPAEKIPHGKEKKTTRDISKPLSFADAVGKSSQPQPQLENDSRPEVASAETVKKANEADQITNEQSSTQKSSPKARSATQQHQQPQQQQQRDFYPADHARQAFPGVAADPQYGFTFFPQGFDDVIEVLCLGETTSGKLLMHFLLHYGQYFDATSTSIDISGKHERALTIPTPYSYLTPFLERSTPEAIDPHTGMLIIDHIVIYDPLEGREKNNVARRCFAWPHVRWIFAQSYATLSSAVEKSPPVATTQHGRPEGSKTEVQPNAVEEGIPETDVCGEPVDPSSQLLMCLISF